MENIWARCPRTDDINKIEEKVRIFLQKHNLSREFSLMDIESWIYNCPPASEQDLFAPLLSKMTGCRLADLREFDTLFRKQLFPQIPQKILNGLSPVKYILLLKRLQE